MSCMLPRNWRLRLTAWAACLSLLVVCATADEPVVTRDNSTRKTRDKGSEQSSSSKPSFVKEADLPWPPTLPGSMSVVTDSSDQLLKIPTWLRDDVEVAKVAPVIDFAFYPGQNYPGVPWSNWGDGSVHQGKYYSGIGDHMAVGRKEGSGENGTGTGFVFEYQPKTKTLRSLVDLAKLLNLPKGHYTPSKVHSRIDMGSDGWLYYATHRGSPQAACDANHYQGDWIFRTNPVSGVAEVVTQGPIPKHSTPASVLDPERMIFYGATAAGPDAEVQSIIFYAYDLKNRRLRYSCPNGPARYMIFAKSTGKLYYVPGSGEGELLCFDPALNTAPRPVGVRLSVRAASEETQEGIVYVAGQGQGQTDADIYAFDVKTEQSRKIGTAAVGTAAYVASLDVDPTGRFLYYVPGAHGSDEPALVQFDVRTGKKKVIAFMNPFYPEKYGFALKGTYSTALSAEGDAVYITWNISRGTKAWDCTGLTVVHIPNSER